MIDLAAFLFWLAMFYWACNGASTKPLLPLFQGMAMMFTGLLMVMSLGALVVRLW